jgi:hypothetical protein
VRLGVLTVLIYKLTHRITKLIHKTMHRSGKLLRICISEHIEMSQTAPLIAVCRPVEIVDRTIVQSETDQHLVSDTDR